MNDITITTESPRVNGLDSHYWDEPEMLIRIRLDRMRIIRVLKLIRRSGFWRAKVYELGPGYHGHPHGSIVVTDGDEWVVWARTAPEFLKNKP